MSEEPDNVTPIGVKNDDDKAPLSLVPTDALIEVARVLKFGADKYAAGNWRHVRPARRYLDAALRHLYAFAAGEDKDPESGFHHLAHAACCVLFLLSLCLQGETGRWETGD